MDIVTNARPIPSPATISGGITSATYPASCESRESSHSPTVAVDSGATRVRGLYVLGLAYQYRRNSHFIGGVGRDAELVAHAIVERGDAPARRRLPVVVA